MRRQNVQIIATGRDRMPAFSFRSTLTLALGFISCVLLTGCLSPIAMHRAVIEYDRTVSYVEADLLLLNIARAPSSASAFHRSLQRGGHVRFPHERRDSGGG